jgi:trimeric autotransporter adhesin
MKRVALLLVAGCLLAWNAAAQSGSAAQPGVQAGASASSSTSAQTGPTGAQLASTSSGSAAAQAGNNSASLASGSTMNATLSHPVDAKKNKPGDSVTARTTQATTSNGQVVLPKGTQLMGHVSQAQARSKHQSESAVGIVFDKAILKNGQAVPLNVTIQALAAASTMASSSMGADDLALGGGAAGGGMASGRRSGSGGAVGAVASPAASVGGAANGAVGSTANVAGGAVNSTANVAGAARGTVGGLNAAGQLTSNSQGVFGLNGLNLTSVPAGSAQGSLITSTSQNVHLDSGTQMVLSATGQAQAQASKQ